MALTWLVLVIIGAAVLGLILDRLGVPGDARMALLAVVVLVAIITWAGNRAQAVTPAADVAPLQGPTSALYLPVLRDMRPTATPTNTATATPTITLTPSNTPTITNTPTASNTPTITNTPTASNTPTVTSTATATVTATATRVPVTGDCSSTPNPLDAPNTPVRIVTVFKSANPETVRLQNVSGQAVNLNGWLMCSITGSQTHAVLSGTLAAGETRDFASTASGPIWNNSSRDDGALYNAGGVLISYWIDPIGSLGSARRRSWPVALAGRPQGCSYRVASGRASPRLLRFL